jgi:hypothetical protein
MMRPWSKDGDGPWEEFEAFCDWFKSHKWVELMDVELSDYDLTFLYVVIGDAYDSRGDDVTGIAQRAKAHDIAKEICDGEI